jgi:hypothetical protein
MLFNRPIETTLGGLSTGDTTKLKKAISTVVALYGPSIIRRDGYDIIGHAAEGPFYPYPFIYNDGGETKVAVDLRGIKQQGKPVSLSRRSDLAYLLLIADLSGDWYLNGGKPYVGEMKFSGAVFANLISMLITRSYRLNDEQHRLVQMTVADYYGYLCHDHVRTPYEDYMRTNVISRITPLPIKEIERFTSIDLKYDEGIKSLTNIIRDLDISPKLKKFNEPTLLRMVDSIYFGLYAKQMIHVSLEYPPVFAASVWKIGTVTTFRKTMLMASIAAMGRRPRLNAKNFFTTLSSNAEELLNDFE